MTQYTARAMHVTPPELNNPVVRQSILTQRVEAGGTLVASSLAIEFDVSLDTIRRDILTLEET
ncbi:MAG: DeoR family transcriptional regulator, partial [Hyphomicrobiales bacterium]